MSSLVMVLPVLVLVQCEGVGGILVMINTVLPLLPQFEVIVEVSLHHNLLLCVQPRDFTLRVDHQDLVKERKVSKICLCFKYSYLVI